MNFEEIVDNKIGFGKYQFIVLGILGLIFIAEGIEMSVLSILLPILKREWEIDSDLQGLLGTVLYLGFFIGSFLSSFLTDKFGRREILIYTSITQFFFGVYSSTIGNVYLFLIIRGVFGFLLGFIIPIIPSLCAEMVPIDKRGKATVIINTLFSVGQLFAAIIGYFCLNSLSSGNWRRLLLICSFPSLIVFLSSLKYLRESPRYLALYQAKSNNNLDLNSVIETIKYIGYMNLGNDYKVFNENDIRNLEIWIYENKHKEEKYDLFSKFKLLFDNEHKYITFCLWIIWFVSNFLFYGFVFILPFFLDELDKENAKKKTTQDGIIILIITTLGEGLSGIPAYFLIENQNFGRKKSLALAMGIASISSFISFITNIKHKVILIISLTFGRFFSKMCFAVLYPFTAELYMTHIRTMGIGMSSAIGRLASCIMPLIVIKLFYQSIYLPFFLYSIVGLVGFTATLSIHIETMGKFLDSNNKLIELKEVLNSNIVNNSII